MDTILNAFKAPFNADAAAKSSAGSVALAYGCAAFILATAISK